MVSAGALPRNTVPLESCLSHGVCSWVPLNALDRADYDLTGTVSMTDIATHA